MTKYKHTKNLKLQTCRLMVAICCVGDFLIKALQMKNHCRLNKIEQISFIVSWIKVFSAMSFYELTVETQQVFSVIIGRS